MDTNNTKPLPVDQRYDPKVVAIGKIIFAFGLVALILWLSPYALTDLLMGVGLPLLVLLGLIAGTGLAGSGFLDLINDRSIGTKVQSYVKEKKEEVQQDWVRQQMAQ